MAAGSSAVPAVTEASQLRLPMSANQLRQTGPPGSSSRLSDIPVRVTPLPPGPPSASNARVPGQRVFQVRLLEKRSNEIGEWLITTIRNIKRGTSCRNRKFFKFFR